MSNRIHRWLSAHPLENRLPGQHVQGIPTGGRWCQEGRDAIHATQSDSPDLPLPPFQKDMVSYLDITFLLLEGQLSITVASSVHSKFVNLFTSFGFLELGWSVAKTFRNDSIIIIIIIILTSTFFQDWSRVWKAASQQHKVEHQPLAT